MSDETDTPPHDELKPESAELHSDTRLRSVCSILESVASQYSPTSPEYLAIKDAATAFMVVHQKQSLRSAYRKLKLAQGGELTPEMKEKLQSMGLDVEKLDADDESCEAT